MHDLITVFSTTAPDDPARALRRGQAIEAWLPLARHLSRRYLGRGEPADDLEQVAMVGLIKAVDRFDPERADDFTAFAIPTILGELKRHFRDRAWAIRVPRRLQELRMAITAANHTLTQTLGRSPTVADIAARLGISEEDVLEGLEGARAYSTTSLSSPVHDEGHQELGDTLGADDHGFELTELRIALGPAIASLSEREQKILSMRFYGNRTQNEIAQQLGISQMHVSRLLAKALQRLRLLLQS
ncbi:SigB/SigF/SigG family RNA polymerase sigma factor [Actinoplanes bogorensis]|uniref:SigB/SigF/SigG family RNA polymerase sigma factor n=1 Tax=Paractinoplanes bogorensis TaxID=1610840 RepID=A0ABS5YVE5_9ACTN|nr:SigB/SigF/SigG family RNA polymerase sigma factor [Actinoplanes bogorensis]MBU2667041.1 SigB/SigF/SigG family RNA polymerase sigma factor [Actinoplanes bogorensis]